MIVPYIVFGRRSKRLEKVQKRPPKLALFLFIKTANNNARFAVIHSGL